MIFDLEYIIILFLKFEIQCNDGHDTHVSDVDYAILLLFIAPVIFDFPFCCCFHSLKLVLIPAWIPQVAHLLTFSHLRIPIHSTEDTHALQIKHMCKTFGVKSWEMQSTCCYFPQLQQPVASAGGQTCRDLLGRKRQLAGNRQDLRKGLILRREFFFCSNNSGVSFHSKGCSKTVELAKTQHFILISWGDAQVFLRHNFPPFLK